MSNVSKISCIFVLIFIVSIQCAHIHNSITEQDSNNLISLSLDALSRKFDKFWVDDVYHALQILKFLKHDTGNVKLNICENLKNSLPFMENDLFYATSLDSHFKCQLKDKLLALVEKMDYTTNEKLYYYIESLKILNSIKADKSSLLILNAQYLLNSKDTFGLNFAFASLIESGFQSKGNYITEKIPHIISLFKNSGKFKRSINKNILLTSTVFNSLVQYSKNEPSILSEIKGLVESTCNYVMTRKSIHHVKTGWYTLLFVKAIMDAKFKITDLLNNVNDLINVKDIKFNMHYDNENVGSGILDYDSLLKQYFVKPKFEKNGTYKLSIVNFADQNHFKGICDVSFDIFVRQSIILKDGSVRFLKSGNEIDTPINFKHTTNTPILSYEYVRGKYSVEISFTLEQSVEQVFLRLFHKKSDQQLYFILEKSNKKPNYYSFNITPSKFSQMSKKYNGVYSVELIIGDRFISNPINYNLGFIKTSLINGHTKVVNSESLPIIKHQFKEKPEHPHNIIPFFFTGLILLCLLAMLSMFSKHIKIASICSTLSFNSIIFYMLYGAIFLLYFLYWTTFNMIETLQILMVLALPTVYFGFKVLSKDYKDSVMNK
ncbi:hypothetical protein A3Q56_06338 [Intoshia linei]|uniref:Dolichyl-diphosphooligosaccharide--protein glycosyltransferase subunit 2 n=1 Tax=Intoshia linei TaxID=1819745 RepID=A0A177AV92_9BILA|nr:hypothetical protein A3Q56_06338 [Intoshia linei]